MALLLRTQSGFPLCGTCKGPLGRCSHTTPALLRSLSAPLQASAWPEEEGESASVASATAAVAAATADEEEGDQERLLALPQVEQVAGKDGGSMCFSCWESLSPGALCVRFPCCASAVVAEGEAGQARQGQQPVPLPHEQCLECFRAYATACIADRKLVRRKGEAVYTICCPLGCKDSLVAPEMLGLVDKSTHARYLRYSAIQYSEDRHVVWCPHCMVGMLPYRTRAHSGENHVLQSGEHEDDPALSAPPASAPSASASANAVTAVVPVAAAAAAAAAVAGGHRARSTSPAAPAPALTSNGVSESSELRTSPFIRCLVCRTQLCTKCHGEHGNEESCTASFQRQLKQGQRESSDSDEGDASQTTGEQPAQDDNEAAATVEPQGKRKRSNEPSPATSSWSTLYSPLQWLGAKAAYAAQAARPSDSTSSSGSQEASANSSTAAGRNRKRKRSASQQPGDEDEDNDEDEDTIKLCPGCSVPIQRAGGCNHVTCASCEMQFCWIHLVKWEEGGACQLDHWSSDPVLNRSYNAKRVLLSSVSSCCIS